ncbi:MAG: ATP-binding cassette domain-containing protein [Cellvibrionaceae bacterium]|nr:ATP-binding cassette domain-containing protein [Cellvibrionaceae bacterium]
MMKLNTVRLQLGTKVLLDNASFTLHPGQKCGLIGANGAGKTSLFRLLLGEIQEDEGRVSVPSQWKLAHMAQEITAIDSRVLDYIIGGDSEYLRIKQAIDSQLDSDKLPALYEQLEHIQGYTIETRAQKLLHGLGFAKDAANRLVSEFSGGWQIRLNLARTLMSRADLLLLDEPTNHLDLDAALWLEDWLKTFPGSLLIISHDRDFLDNIVSHIYSVEHQQIHTYKGNYSDYEQQKAERLAQQSAAYQKQQQRIAEIEDFVRRFRAKATKAKQAQSRLKEMQRMEKIAAAHVDSPFSFVIPVAEKVPETLLNIEQAALGYDNQTIVENINLTLLASSRIGLLGKNGAGKSTLIKALAGETQLLQGELNPSLHLKLGYYAQHQLEALDLSASAALHVQRLSPRASEQEIRNYLGGFGFQGDRAFENISHFSGGEKARVALALICWQKPNLLLLDEPTNHLDLEMRQALTLALQNFSGAVVIVSHDRHLLKNSVDEFLLVDAGRVQSFDGTLDDYQLWLQQNKNHAEDKETLPTGKQDKKAQRQTAAAKREKLKPLMHKIKQLERELESSQKQLQDIDQQLGDTELYNTADSKLSKLMKTQGELRKQISDREEHWLTLNDELENLRQK